MENQRGLLSFVIGVVMGALVGVSLALLLAPASGEELRSQIQDQFLQIQSEVSQAAEQRRAELERQLADLRSIRRPAPPQ